MIDVACVRTTGQPTVVDVVQHFKSYDLNVNESIYEGSDRFQMRGCTRNDQLKSCRADWIWFADCDHVYHPEYVERLLAELKNHEDETRLLTAGRMSTEPGIDPFEFPEDEPVYHRLAYARANEVEPKYRRSAPGAGHTQIVKVANLPDRVYVPEGRSRDHKWSERGTKAKSDIQFRRKVGGKVVLPKWFTLNQIHLNHRRDSKEGNGQHLTEQR